MASRQFYTTESLGESTTTTDRAGGGSTKCTLTFTPDADATYTIFCSADVTSDDSTADYFVGTEVYEGSTCKYGAGFRPKEFTTPGGFFCLVFYTAPSSPSSVSWTLRFYSNFGVGTVRIKNARMTAVKMDDTHDHYITNYNYSEFSIASTTSSTLQTWDTLTFTPASAGDYLVIGNAAMAMDANNTAMRGRLNHTTASVTYGDRVWYAKDPWWFQPFAVMEKLTLGAASQTFKLQFRSNSGTLCYYRDARILALRLDAFQGLFRLEPSGAEHHVGVGHRCPDADGDPGGGGARDHCRRFVQHRLDYCFRLPQLRQGRHQSDGVRARGRQRRRLL